MVQRKGGNRRKTRGKFSKKPRDQGKISLRRALQTFETGDPVLLSAEPAVQGGLYYARFHGKAGRVVREQGGCYVVSVKDGNKQKELIINPVHLKRQ